MAPPNTELSISTCTHNQILKQTWLEKCIEKISLSTEGICGSETSSLHFLFP